MSITVRRANGGVFEVVSGARRLKVALNVFGKVAVTDAESGNTFDVHEVDGQLIELPRHGESEAKTFTKNGH